MSNLIQRHLLSKESETFLESQEYCLHRHVSRSFWIGPGVSLYLEETDVIIDMYSLNVKISEQAFNRGVIRGKITAAELLTKQIYNVLFKTDKVENPEY